MADLSAAEKEALARMTGAPIRRIVTWMANARARLWRPAEQNL